MADEERKALLERMRSEMLAAKSRIQQIKDRDTVSPPGSVDESAEHLAPVSSIIAMFSKPDTLSQYNHMRRKSSPASVQTAMGKQTSVAVTKTTTTRSTIGNSNSNTNNATTNASSTTTAITATTTTNNTSVSGTVTLPSPKTSKSPSPSTIPVINTPPTAKTNIPKITTPVPSHSGPASPSTPTQDAPTTPSRTQHFLAATAELKALRENKGRISNATLLVKDFHPNSIKSIDDLQQAIDLKKKQMEEERAKFQQTAPTPPPSFLQSAAMQRVTSVQGMRVSQLNNKLENFLDHLKAFEMKMEMEKAKAPEESDQETDDEKGSVLVGGDSGPIEPVEEVKTEDIISTNEQVSKKQLEKREKRRTMMITAELKKSEINLLNAEEVKKKEEAMESRKSEEFRDGLSKGEWMRHKVIEELISTEEDYINDLMLTSKLFYMPIREKKLLKEKTVETIFSSMNMLLGVNLELLKEFKKELDSGTGNIGAAFCWMSDFLKMYSGYCNNQDTALRTLDKMQKSNSRFDHFLKEQLKNPECRQLPLNSYIIKPVQRITKYPLLLRELLKYTDPSHPDHKSLEKALEHMQQILSEINENARKVEYKTKAAEFRERLDKGKKIIDPGKHLYQMEAVFKEATYDPVKKSFEVAVDSTVYILFNSLLVRATDKGKSITLSNGRRANALKLIEAIPVISLTALRNVTDDEHNKNIRNAFEITYKMKKDSPASNIIVLASTKELKKEWVTAMAMASTKAFQDQYKPNDQYKVNL